MPMPIPITEKLKALYKTQNTLPKLIEDEMVPELKLDEYYVDLQLILDDKHLAKEQIRETQIFDQISNKLVANRVLIVGESGTGKSTLMQKIAYMWGIEKIFQTRFDYVFKVRLKLLSTNWQKYYSNENLLRPIISLKCFIDYSLQLELNLASSKIHEEELIEKSEIFSIINNDNKSKILLLLDGYDEIESLLNSRNNQEIKTIIDEIFKFENIVMTSRPSSLNSGIERFFSRFIENKGFSLKSAQKYIDQYFTKQKNTILQEIDNFYKLHSSSSIFQNILEYLRSPDNSKFGIFLQLEKIGINTHSIAELNNDQITAKIENYYISSKNLIAELLQSSSVLRELIITPINAAMLSLIFSDQNNIIKFNSNEEFSIGQLYNEFIILLGKRYQIRYQDSISISSEGIFSIAELQKLKYIAYQTFEGNYNITGYIINNVSNYYVEEARNIINFGLLKILKKSDINLLENIYDFIHPSFKEYLIALYLKDQLLNNNDVESRRIAEFIAEHRNEPKYLNILKFTANLITQEKVNEIGVIKFWEAMLCNVDQIIELSINAKVTLLMHLLPQAKLNGEIDNRIPYLKKMLTLVDTVIAIDVIGFHEQLIASSYTSYKVTEAILATLDLNYKWSIQYADIMIQEQKEFMELTTSYLKNLVNNRDQEEKLVGLATEVLISNNISFVLEADHYKKAKAPILHTTQLQISIFLLSNLAKKGNISYQDFINKILVSLHYPSWQVKLVAIHALEQHIKDKSNSLNFNIELAIKIINIVQWHITDDNLKQEIFSLLLLMQEIIRDEEKQKLEIFIKEVFIDQLQIFYKTKEVQNFLDNLLNIYRAEIFTCEIVNMLIEQLENPNWLQRYIAIIFVQKIVESSRNFINQNIVIHIIDKLSDKDQDIATIAIQVLHFIDLNKLSNDILSKLQEKYDNANESTRKLINTLFSGKINRPVLISSRIDEQLDDEYGYDISAEESVEIMVNDVESNQPIEIEYLIKQLDDRSCDNRMEALNSAMNKYEAIKKIEELVITEANLINIKVINSLISLLNHEDECSNHYRSSYVLKVIVEKRPDLIDRKIVEDLMQLFNDSYDSWPYIICINNVINAIASHKPELIDDNIINILISQLSSSCFRAMMSTNSVIEKIATVKPDLIDSKIVDTLITQLSNSNFAIRVAASKALGVIVILNKKYILLNITNLIEVLSYKANSIKITYDVIEAIAISKPELISGQMVDSLIVQLGSNDPNAIVSFSKTIEVLVTNKPELINSTLTSELLELLKNSDTHIKVIISKIIRIIAKNKCELITPIVISSLNSLLNSDNYEVRVEAMKGFEVILIHKPELIEEQVISSLIAQLDDSYFDIRTTAAQVVITAAVYEPELVEIGKIEDKIDKSNDQYFNIRTVNKAINVIFAKESIIELTNELESVSSIVRLVASKAIGMIAIKKSELIDSRIINNLINLLNDGDIAIQEAACDAIRVIVVNQSLLINAAIIENLMELLSDNVEVKNLRSDYEDYDVRAVAGEALAAIASKRVDLIQSKMIDSMVGYLSDRDSSVIEAASKFIEGIAANRHKLISDNNIIDKLLERLGTTIDGSNEYIIKTTTKAIDTVIRYEPKLIDIRIINSIIIHLNNANSEIKSVIYHTLLNVIMNPTLTSIAIELLYNSKKDVREFTTQILIMMLSNPEELIKIKINTIFAIIGFYDYQNDQEKKDLMSTAKNALNIKLSNIVKEDIALINIEYNALLRISSESLLFMQKLFDKVLDSSIITETERNFIIKSIENDIIDISIKLNEHAIISKGKTYQLSAINKEYFEEIKAAALRQTDNILVQQYITHQPIFINSGIGLKIASYDNKKVDISLFIHLNQAQEDARNYFKKVVGPEGKYYKQDNVIITNSILDTSFRENIAKPDLNNKMYYLADIVFDKEENSARLSDYYCDLVGILAEEDTSKFKIKKWIYNNDNTEKNIPIHNTTTSTAEIMNQNSVEELSKNASIVLLSLAKKVKIIKDANSACSEARKADVPSSPYNMKIDILAEKYRPKLNYDFNHIKEMLRDIKTINKSEATKECYANEHYSIKINLNDYLMGTKMYPSDINYGLDIACISYAKVEKIPIIYNWLDKRIFTFVHEDQEVQDQLSKFCRIPTFFIFACGKNVHFKSKEIIVNKLANQNKEIPDNIISIISAAIDNIEEEFSILHNGQAIDECKILGFEYQDLCFY